MVLVVSVTIILGGCQCGDHRIILVVVWFKTTFRFLSSAQNFHDGDVLLHLQANISLIEHGTIGCELLHDSDVPRGNFLGGRHVVNSDLGQSLQNRIILGRFLGSLADDLGAGGTDTAEEEHNGCCTLNEQHEDRSRSVVFVGG